MYSLLIGISLFAGVLLIIVVLAQNSKGGGLSSQFGGSGVNNIMGVKKTGDLLETLTWICISVIIVAALGTNLINTPTGGSDDILDRVGNNPAPTQTLPKPVQKDSAN